MDTDLIDRIYEASVVPELWPDVLDELSELTDARGGLLFAVQDPVLNWTASDSVHDAFESYVVDGWFRRCGRRICMFKHAHSAFLREHDYWSEEELENNEIYRDFFRPRDLGYSAGTGLAIPTGDNIVFSIEQSYSNGPLESAQVALLNELRPHLARSAMVAARLGLKSARGASETLAKLGVPTILLKADGTAIDISYQSVTGNAKTVIYAAMAASVTVFAPGGLSGRIARVGNAVAIVAFLLLVALIVSYSAI